MNISLESAPIIGIGMNDINEKGEYRIPAYYVNAVRAAGGIPVCIPPSEQHYENLLASVDGFVLAGGGDINPTRYHGQCHDEIYGINDNRDESEFLLAKLLLQHQIPTLAICRGLQVINCVLGGTLISHIPDNDQQACDRLEHRHKDASLLKRTVVHDVTLTANSKLAQAYDSISFPVISWHHQAIDRMADGFEAVAVASDGTIEAIESSDYPSLIAIQWHPEMPMEKDDIHPRLFNYFIQQSIKQSLLRV